MKKFLSFFVIPIILTNFQNVQPPQPENKKKIYERIPMFATKIPPTIKFTIALSNCIKLSSFII